MPSPSRPVADRRGPGGNSGRRCHRALCASRRPGYRCPAPADAEVARVARLALREPADDRERHVGRGRYPIQARPQRAAPVSAEYRSGRAGALRGTPILGAAGDLAGPLDHSARDRRASLPDRPRVERAGWADRFRRTQALVSPGARPPRTAAAGRSVALPRPLRSPRLRDHRRPQGPQPPVRRSAGGGSAPRAVGRSRGADRRGRLVGLAHLWRPDSLGGAGATRLGTRAALRRWGEALDGLRVLGRSPSGLLLRGYRALSGHPNDRREARPVRPHAAPGPPTCTAPAAFAPPPH